MSAEFFGFSDFGGLDAAANQAMLVFMIVYMVILGFAMIYGAVVYVLQSLGLYTIAKRRCIHHPWLAWVPIANMWLLGSISDQYQFVAKGKIRNRRKVLLGLLIGVYAFMLVFFIFMFAGALNGGFEIDNPGNFTFVATMGSSVIFYLIAWLMSVVAMVFMYIAYYDLFASCNPNNAVVFLVLSIFFNFLLPFFVFACRKKDEGMPPRRVQIPVAPWTPAAEAPIHEEVPPVHYEPAPVEEEMPSQQEMPQESVEEV